LSEVLASKADPGERKERNMAFGGKLKSFVQRCVKVFDYRIEKHQKGPRQSAY
jgi:hypothetical protein